MTDATPGPEAPLLRTLSPALRGLEHGLRAWLDGPRRYPLSTMARAALEGMALDLRRQADALEVERPLLAVVLMGGTGVGKSSLLNALAGGAVARASFTRPTTRDPVVYYHESVKPDRLDPALRHCRLVPHDRPSLAQKILIDTPDLDSNDLANREKLFHVLPVADVVLYVGSQEKYHDEIGWQLFLEQRRRRAFAFVLNKWDRCVHRGDSGLRPDEDLLRDLKSEGFEAPLVFRTCAQAWIDATPPLATAPDGETPAAPVARLAPVDLPEGEQFAELLQWLEMGLTKLEVEAIKARGVGQLLQQLEQSLQGASPPDLTETALRTRQAWTVPLTEEAAATTDVLLSTLEPYQSEIEHHFTVEGQRRFRGLMAGYLQMFNRAKYLGVNLRDKIPFLPKPRETVSAPAAWDASRFARACSEIAGNRHLDARGKALANRLLVEADAQGYALKILADPVEAASKTDWRQRYALAMSEVLHEVEKQRSEPTGVRRYVQAVLGFLADWAPPVALVAAIALFLCKWLNVWQQTPPPQIEWVDVALLLVVPLIVLILLHVLIALLLPLRWATIRAEFKAKLEKRLLQELENVYGPVPEDVAALLQAERRQVEKVAGETRDVASWLQQREQTASVSGLYGK
jgi:50S ribosome-binding GTPase